MVVLYQLNKCLQNRYARPNEAFNFVKQIIIYFKDASNDTITEAHPKMLANSLFTHGEIASKAMHSKLLLQLLKGLALIRYEVVMVGATVQNLIKKILVLLPGCV